MLASDARRPRAVAALAFVSLGALSISQDARGQASPVPGPTATLERLSTSDIQRVVVARRSEVVACVNEQRRADPGRAGRVVVRFSILPTGRTTGVTVTTAETRTTRMASCLVRNMRGWTFPRHRVQGPPVDYPFTF